MSAMESPVEEVQEALRKLEVVQQQQKASLAGMQLLASQHQESISPFGNSFIFLFI